MESQESHREHEPSLVDPEAYIGKLFFSITTEQIAQLPDGTAIRPFYMFFKPDKAIIVDQGTRPWLTRPQKVNVYGFLETDQIPNGLRFDPKGIRIIQRDNILAEDLPPN